MEINEIFEFINTTGFAIVVAVYFLWYNNKSMKTMNDTLIELKTLIESIAKKDRKDDEE